MELTFGSISLSTSINETLTSRWSSEMALAQSSRATSVSRVSVSGRRNFASAGWTTFAHGGRGSLSWSNSSEEIAGLGCKLCIQGQRKSRTLHDLSWQASAVADFSGTDTEDLSNIASDDLSSMDSAVHIIKEGDTLTAIAKRYNTTISRLAGDNGIEDIDVLLPGERILVHFPAVGLRKIPSRIQSEIPVVTSNVLAKVSTKGVKELNTATTSGYDSATSFSHVGGHSSFHVGTMAQVIIPLLLIAPVVGFCVRCAVDYIQDRIRKEINSKHAELESYRSRHRPKVKRWQGILDEDREEALDHGYAAAESDSLDEYRFRNEHQIPTGYASIRAMNEDSIANESDEERSSRHLQDYEDIRKSYAELESTYMKFLSDSGLSRSGYWRGSVTQLQEEI